MMGLRLGERSDQNNAEMDGPVVDTLRNRLLRREGLGHVDGGYDEDLASIAVDDIDELELSYPVEEAEVASILEDDHAATAVPPSRRWTKTDRMDLTKLGNMISSFLEEPRFAADAKLFQTHVITPLLDQSGPRFGSVQVVKQVMQSVMIRHRCGSIPHFVTPLISRWNKDQ